MSSMLLHPEVQTPKGFLPITGTDYIELYVGNARQSAYFYRAALGMCLVAWAGPETGLHDRASYVLQQGNIRLVLTTPLRPDGGMAEHIRRHGDGVRDIAMCVTDAKLAWREATKRGARSVHECHTLEDHCGRVKVASVAAYGDTIHTFVERENYTGPFLPGYESTDEDHAARPVGLTRIDHISGNVGWNELHRWVDFYRDTLGFSLYPKSGEAGPAGYLSFKAQVVSSAEGRILFPLKEPAEGRDRSRIEQYLESYHGPGVENIALATGDMLGTVAKLRQQGVQFSSVPSSYYRQLRARVGNLDEPLEELERLGILVDRDDDGYLLQAFTRPVEDRPTLFFQIIQRKGSRGFGEGNHKALAEAIAAEKRFLRYR
ncbi:4-hydroxyphenylpyruvate dioxygenase [Acidisarcina polymorpha]|uniref:4-hydroxyphenylpyruvate dioxygenase n=1 Tax=Acidisarcina polymorpha TaxID=2211140 RepID=A0A2Z5GA38_9BACT|nr:4-hydroxyphenylpyruvate dioxygenase [Acidisarcina polymorpha]AXC15868.1 4-hydroxyphenylpyruvate dioxygenase [Acidisarcina polymorpha]